MTKITIEYQYREKATAPPLKSNSSGIDDNACNAHEHQEKEERMREQNRERESERAMTNLFIYLYELYENLPRELAKAVRCLVFIVHTHANRLPFTSRGGDTISKEHVLQSL